MRLNVDSNGAQACSCNGFSANRPLHPVFSHYLKLDLGSDMLKLFCKSFGGHNGALLPYTGAKTAQVITIDQKGCACPNHAGFAATLGEPAHCSGENAVMLVLFISAVALVGLALVPNLSP
jgi:hypothetical protein